MLRQLHIENFKAWEDSGEIRLAPLTIFCGNNSSGKSSIAQFLLMLKQTVESYDRKRVLHLGDKDSKIDLGTYRDIVHRNETDRKLRFKFEYDAFPPLKITDATIGPKDLRQFSRIAFEAEVAFDEKRSLTVNELQYTLKNGKSVDFRLVSGDGNKYDLTADGYTLRRQQGRGWKLPPPENFFGFPDEAVAYYQNTGFLPDLSLSIKNLFRSMYYVGPLRDHPERFYQFSGDAPADVGDKGKLAVNALLAAKEAGRKISPGERKRYVDFEHWIAQWLQQMRLIHSFRVVPIAKDRKEYEVRIRVNQNSPEVLITDVGFGISQILPVIVQCFYVPSNSILFFEQPEIHLHPSVQSHLGDLFIDAIKVKEGGKSRNTQIIVESHSEHLIRRIQRRVAEGKISPEDVAIYFIHQDRNGAKMESLNIDLFGNVTNWPENFFGDELEDLMAMTEAARKKAQEK
ncbi:MAG: DUF3696 domain-containing protein [Flavobacteriales bacterium]|nr:DUF3696 domain-containing protein [Flavobacteriales bacterium]